MTFFKGAIFILVCYFISVPAAFAQNEAGLSNNCISLQECFAKNLHKYDDGISDVRLVADAAMLGACSMLYEQCDQDEKTAMLNKVPRYIQDEIDKNPNAESMRSILEEGARDNINGLEAKQSRKEMIIDFLAKVVLRARADKL